MLEETSKYAANESNMATPKRHTDYHKSLFKYYQHVDVTYRYLIRTVASEPKYSETRSRGSKDSIDARSMSISFQPTIGRRDAQGEFGRAIISGFSTRACDWNGKKNL
jgi:hypothetical protein